MFRIIAIIMTLLVAVITGCNNDQQAAGNHVEAIVSATPPAQASDNPGDADPFGYCELRSMLDEPGPDYTGDAIPAVISASLRQQLADSGQTLNDWNPEQVQWRCMAGKVYACSPRNGLDCQVKLNFNRVGSADMQNFCQSHHNSVKIPATVVAQESPYIWMCDVDKPMVKSQYAKADPAGFNAAMWFLVPRPAININGSGTD